ncbi:MULTISPECIES: type II secretion system minor pseudopilin GspH [Aliiglaciecola]|uniref:type II secretion system minor pseudopilin GspH n=2 Tax=Alteromonadaceae TaxID=72275 RepID=UPI001C0962AD|nr:MULTISPECIES: type II secretion system minor pseudopilin GspH [Aliiglaciecola]MBU2877528.1 type II secretion system minor pseudopilin GspH [Aliiglaciecola lipolytica]MDO6711108.1 type II secretion system minor pseudopilin GspH [Aliiglaciecola sp. 2_MG-2023]MDO6752022.1 type II secretion system minor pseudopilin GspH [Aliiglaciecola sp. 1_MG-2023]
MRARSLKYHSGFTLIEIMAVLAIMGIVISVISFNNFSPTPSEELEKQAKRFQIVVDMASDFAVLNQQELGIRIEPETAEYIFMQLDEEQNWQLLEGQQAFGRYQLPEPYSLALELDELPWIEEDNLFSDGIFDESLSFDEDRVDIGSEEEEKKLPPPQIMLLSSGDVTPFSLTMMYEPDFSNDDPVYFKLNAIDSVPLERLGPLDSDL